MAINVSWRQLTYFVATAEAGSTLRAAEALHVSQPAISVAIGQLELSFGQKLFVRRHAQGVDLTPFGRSKLAEVRHLLAHAHAVMDSTKDGRLTGELEIGVFSTLAPAYAPGLLRAFGAAHPDVRVRLREATLDQLHRDLADGVVELALLYDLDTIGEMARTPLAALTPYALLARDHPLAGMPQVSLRDLAQEPFVLIDLPHSRDYFLSLFRMIGVMPEQLLRCTSLETVRGMVAHGLGNSVLVTRPFGDHSHDGVPLICRPLEESVPPQRVIIGSSAHAPMTRAAEAFVTVAKDYFHTRGPT
ncbi:LysR family transcriptional regulator [Ancylobacter pratisalsi]|uniref:LysR family transcriptional regulator n=1 Tax=Ancylobacter pratisalsi TaxID=1745854 RepID=A0A6P1YR86_9HYPH|nr:LysR family transcriptional regulator [Ancylobacter pratisalsi]QIB34254.1 LysR family transcriptional regulator [Ancylobacter pratisalsi]